MYYNYVLYLKTGEFYKGLTDNIDRRLDQHSSGKVSSTKNKLPFQLVHVEFCKTRLEAREIEKFLKSGYGREVIQEIAENLRMW